MNHMFYFIIFSLNVSRSHFFVSSKSRSVFPFGNYSRPAVALALQMSDPTPLAAFLAVLGPEFDAPFVAEHLGSPCLDDIIELTVDISDLQELVAQGMKPLLKNKLWPAIVKEREIRCADASNRVLLNDLVASN